MTDEMKSKAKDKYLSFTYHQDALFDASMYSESKKKYICVFGNTSDLTSILNTRVNDMNRIAEEMLSKTWLDEKWACAKTNMPKKNCLNKIHLVKNSYNGQSFMGYKNYHSEDDMSVFHYNAKWILIFLSYITIHL